METWRGSTLCKCDMCYRLVPGATLTVVGPPGDESEVCFSCLKSATQDADDEDRNPPPLSHEL